MTSNPILAPSGTGRCVGFGAMRAVCIGCGAEVGSQCNTGTISHNTTYKRGRTELVHVC